jgi:thiol-disulfide isomerase/thioredoxin
VKKEKSKKKQIWNWISNGLLALIILTLIIPSWRTTFQSWFHGLTMSSADFTEQESIPMPPEQANWALFKMDGQMVNFADFKGKPIVVSFWATWCGPCRAEMPSLGRLRSHWDDEIVFVGASNEPIETIEASGLPSEYDFLYSTQNYPPFFAVEVLPTLAILDKDMNLVFKTTGAQDLNTEENVAFLNELKNR